MKKAFAFAALAALSLAACATSTPYGPATADNRYGFSDTKIEENRFRIMFRGNSSTERETVETFLLYRAAEVTLQNGYDYFVVLEQDTEENRRYSTTSSPAFFGGYGFGPYWGAFPYYAYGWGWGAPFGPGFGPGFGGGFADTREITKYTAMAFITMHRGPKPAQDPQAFDARSVVENLKSYVAPPPAS